MKLTKKRLIVIAIIILVIVGGALLVGWWWLSTQNKPPTSGPSSSSGGSSQAPPVDQKLVDTVNQKYGTGDYQGAIDLIQSQKNVKDVGTQLLLAGAYANAGNLKQALAIYQQLDAAGQLPQSSLANMAEMAERAGDYKTAIDAYKRAKQYTASSSSENEDQAAVYDYKIAELEKKL